jgi:hypothetical protein
MTKVEFDDALNEAGWVLLDEIMKYQEVDPHLFNNLKVCLKLAIEVYLTEKAKEESK